MPFRTVTDNDLTRSPTASVQILCTEQATKTNDNV